jgi:hypothetical protein
MPVVDYPLSACACIREHHCSGIQAWLRFLRCFVSTAINDLRSFLPREDEIIRSGCHPFAWFSMATDNGLAVWAAVVRFPTTYKPLHTKHFEKPLTICTGLRKDKVRPGKVPKTRRRSVRGQGYVQESYSVRNALILIFYSTPEGPEPKRYHMFPVTF